ncbi:hypothetical protein V6N13_098887 [Hibiscus sabdariffa]
MPNIKTMLCQESIPTQCHNALKIIFMQDQGTIRRLWQNTRKRVMQPFRTWQLRCKIWRCRLASLPMRSTVDLKDLCQAIPKMPGNTTMNSIRQRMNQYKSQRRQLKKNKLKATMPAIRPIPTIETMPISRSIMNNNEVDECQVDDILESILRMDLAQLCQGMNDASEVGIIEDELSAEVSKDERP